MDRVLIVDDDKQLCALLIERLKPEAFAIETVYEEFAGWSARSQAIML